MKTYYKTQDGDLILHNSDFDTYILKNTIKDNNILSEDEFEILNCKKINKNLYRELLNTYFKNVNHKWKYQDKWFKKLPNLNSKSYDFKERISKIPIHEISIFVNVCLMYYQSRVIYVHLFYNGTQQCQLWNTHNSTFRGWTNINNLSPILDLETKKII